MIRILRHTLCLALLLTLAACEKDREPRIEVSTGEIHLPGDASSGTTFTVSAEEPWTLSYTGEGFAVTPDGGARGETTVTVTASEPNSAKARRKLGTITVRHPANKDGYLGSVWFMDGMKNDTVTVKDKETDKGFFRFTVNSDGIYELKDSDDTVATKNGEVTSDATGIATDVCFTTAKGTVITSGAATVDGVKYYDTIQFVGVSMNGATVIDTRSSDDMKGDVYSNEINTTTKLVAALNKDNCNVAADVYVENGKITFIAVKAVTDAK